MKSFLYRTVVTSSLLLVWTSSSFAGIIALSKFTPGQQTTRTDNKTWGWQFEPIDDIKIDSLGAWDFQGDGFAAGTHRVGIWNQSRQLVAEAVVKSDSDVMGGTVAGGVFRFEDLATEVLLPKNNLYVVGMTMDPDQFYSLNQNVSLNSVFKPGVSGRERVSTASGFSYPLASSDSIGYFGPNFTFETVIEKPLVPEPGSAAVFAIGTLAMISFRRKRKSIR